eukprot:2654219-Rhodomonas_salina.1
MEADLCLDHVVKRLKRAPNHILVAPYSKSVPDNSEFTCSPMKHLDIPPLVHPLQQIVHNQTACFTSPHPRGRKIRAGAMPRRRPMPGWR